MLSNTITVVLHGGLGPFRPDVYLSYAQCDYHSHARSHSKMNFTACQITINLLFEFILNRFGPEKHDSGVFTLREQQAALEP